LVQKKKGREPAENSQKGQTKRALKAGKTRMRKNDNPGPNGPRQTRTSGKKGGENNNKRRRDTQPVKKQRQKLNDRPGKAGKNRRRSNWKEGRPQLLVCKEGKRRWKKGQTKTNKGGGMLKNEPFWEIGGKKKV